MIIYIQKENINKTAILTRSNISMKCRGAGVGENRPLTRAQHSPVRRLEVR